VALVALVVGAVLVGAVAVRAFLTATGAGEFSLFSEDNSSLGRFFALVAVCLLGIGDDENFVTGFTIGFAAGFAAGAVLVFRVAVVVERVFLVA
jgi:hypothetical protein